MDCSLTGSEYLSGLPFPPPGDRPNPGVTAESVTAPALAGRGPGAECAHPKEHCVDPLFRGDTEAEKGRSPCESEVKHGLVPKASTHP